MGTWVRCVIRIDASLVQSHSDKQHAAGNFKGGYGFHPLLAWCDNTGELLAVICPPGNAGSNTAADHIAIIDAAIAAIPAKWRRKLLITIDEAGCSHAVVEHLRKLNARPGWSVAYSVGFDLDERARVAIGQMPAAGWEAALDAAGKARDDAQVAELTGLLREGADGDRLDGWPADMRILVRREKIEHGTQLSLFEQINGYRYQVIATATRGGQVQRLEARHGCTPGGGVHPLRQGHRPGPLAIALVRDQHRLGHRGRLAIDLLCWMRLLLLDGPLAKTQPATLRYRLLHAAARLVKRSRYLILRVPQTWPGHRIRASGQQEVLREWLDASVNKNTTRCPAVGDRQTFLRLLALFAFNNLSDCGGAVRRRSREWNTGFHSLPEEVTPCSTSPCWSRRPTRPRSAQTQPHWRPR